MLPRRFRLIPIFRMIPANKMSDFARNSGFIINKYEFSNTSLIFNFLTETNGIIKILARGAKSKKTGFAGKLEFFSHIECDYIVSPKSELSILKECTLLKTYLKIRNETTLFFLFSYMMEIINLFPWNIEESSTIFLILKLAMDLCETTDDPNKYKIFLFFYMAKIMVLLGFRPNTSCCARCKNPICSECYAVIYPQPGFACRYCVTKKDKELLSTQLSGQNIEEINNFFVSLNPSEISVIPDENSKKLESVFNFFIYSISGRRIKSYKLLEDIGFF